MLFVHWWIAAGFRVEESSSLPVFVGLYGDASGYSDLPGSCYDIRLPATVFRYILSWFRLPPFASKLAPAAPHLIGMPAPVETSSHMQVSRRPGQSLGVFQASNTMLS